MKMIWNKETGEAREYETVDAREILKNSELYTDQNPNPPKDPDGDGYEGAPVNEAVVQNEYRRDPVGDDPPEKATGQVIIRNPVTDRPRMAPPAGAGDRSVGKGPRGKWYVKTGSERVAGPFETEDEAKAAMAADGVDDGTQSVEQE